MGLGSTAKKIQTVADTAEQVYTKLNEVREEVDRMRETVSATEERVERLEGELAEQRALVAALAEAQGIDTESVVEEAASGEAESGTTDDGDETETTHDGNKTETTDDGASDSPEASSGGPAA